MEDVLEVYQRPYDGNEVLVCMDETSKQQVKETRNPERRTDADRDRRKAFMEIHYTPKPSVPGVPGTTAAREYDLL